MKILYITKKQTFRTIADIEEAYKVAKEIMGEEKEIKFYNITDLRCVVVKKGEKNDIFKGNYILNDTQ